MKNKLATAGVAILIAFTAAGCSETFKEFLIRVTPVIGCEKEAREYADWVAKGKPIDRGGAAEKEIARKAIDKAHEWAVKECAKSGVIIN